MLPNGIFCVILHYGLLSPVRRENNELQISNNINTDTNCYRSFGIGIQSLSEQYKIENKPQPKIAVKDGIYEVRIAILKIRNIHA